jgi:transcriptional regulator with XRE-family HTH domain
LLLLLFEAIQRKSKEGDRMRLRQIREDLRWTQQQLATASGISQPQISALERWADNPTLETLRRLASALGCTVDELAADPVGPEVET